jgi:hypothetical protein
MRQVAWIAEVCQTASCARNWVERWNWRECAYRNVSWWTGGQSRRAGRFHQMSWTYTRSRGPNNVQWITGAWWTLARTRWTWSGGRKMIWEHKADWWIWRVERGWWWDWIAANVWWDWITVNVTRKGLHKGYCKKVWWSQEGQREHMQQRKGWLFKNWRGVEEERERKFSVGNWRSIYTHLEALA